MNPKPLYTLALLALATAASPAFAANAPNPRAPMGPSPEDMAKINSVLKAQLEAADPAVKPIFDRDATFDPLTGPAAIFVTHPILAANSGDGDYMVAPPYANAPELTYQDGVPKGKVYEFTMSSADSKIYPGLPSRASTTGVYTRQVAVYVPSQYVPGTPVPVIVAQDGYLLHYNTLLPPILDNMIADHRLPVMVAVMVNSGGGDGPGSERGLEYDTVSSAYADFIETEVLPKVAHDYNIVFTKDPDARMTIGGSSGGAAALTMAWYHPELYHRVITYSGTYTNNQSPVNPDLPHGAWEYHEHLIPQSDPKPIRLWLEAGQGDNGATTAESGMRNWLIANQHMATVLKAKGYHYQFVAAVDAGHVDSKVVGQTLPSALQWVWQGYPVAPAK